MADWNEQQRTQQSFNSVPRTGDLAPGVTFDEGLRKHMLSIYNYMTSGVLLTGIVALLTARSGLAVTFAIRPANVDCGTFAARHCVRDELWPRQV